MSVQGPVLVGIGGVVEGELFPLAEGKSVVIGRSRDCDISMRKCKRWEKREEAESEFTEGSRTVSRRHLKITVYGADRIELEDLSSNGTFVDGKRIDRLVLTDVRSTAHEIMLGAGETFRIEWR